MSDYGHTAENYLSTLPIVLKEDPKFYALATSIAFTLAKEAQNARLANVYNRIDELPEELLDIIAYDFKIDWYDYDYPIDAKRQLIKTGIYIRKRIGTIGAVSTGVQAVYPRSTIEEWFDYKEEGGEPFHFRVVLDLNRPVLPVSVDSVVRAIAMYKPLRCKLDGIYYRSLNPVLVGCSTGYIIYSVRVCGTYPYRAQNGRWLGHLIIVETDAKGIPYTSPKTGTLSTGTHPTAAQHGADYDESIVVETVAHGLPYASPRTDVLNAGMHPMAAQPGVVLELAITAAANGHGIAHRSPAAGLTPESAVQGSVFQGGGISVDASSGCGSFGAKMCGNVL